MPRLRHVLLVALAALFLLPAGSALAAAVPPGNVTLPVITVGRPQVGTTLSTSDGAWNGDLPMTFAYQWRRCDAQGANCADIAGATGSSYTLTNSDAAKTLVVKVTASNAGGTASVTSEKTVVIPSFVVDTTHFAVHYQSDVTSGSGITSAQAGTVAAMAEDAYTTENGLGYLGTKNDDPLGGDSRTDIYVVSLAGTGAAGLAITDGGSPTSSGYIELDPTDGLTQRVIAHEYFHLVQYNLWVPSVDTAAWLLEGSAEWMGYDVTSFPLTDIGDIGNWDFPIDCRDPIATNQCNFDDYQNDGYSRWPFFEYLAEKYGGSFMKTVLQDAALEDGVAALPATAGLSDALVARGTTLSGAYNDFVSHLLGGTFTPAALQSLLPTANASVSTGTIATLNVATPAGSALVKSGAIPSTSVVVSHLGTKFVAVDRGGSLADSPCFAATLTLSVALPSGISTVPYFWWSQPNDDGTKQAVQALTVSGSTATITLPWDTCQWGSSGYLALPNTSTTVDGAEFKVTGTLSVDTTTPAVASAPPARRVIPGTSVGVSGADGVPALDVVGPAVFHVSSDDKALRLTVVSSGSGSATVTLGSTALGTFAVRAGTNVVVAPLPAALPPVGVLQVLTVTPLAPGGASGTAVGRQLVVDAATVAATAKAKPKAKANAKAKAKAKAKARAKRRLRRR